MACLVRMRHAGARTAHPLGETPYADDGVLRDDLWAAYLALLEHDARNAPQFLHYGDLRAFLQRLLLERRTLPEHWTGDAGRLSAVQAEMTALVMHLVVLTDSPALILAEPPPFSACLAHVIRCLDITAYQVPQTYAPPTHFVLPQPRPDPLPEPRTHTLTHFAHSLTLTPPPLAPAAHLAAIHRLESALDRAPLSISAEDAAGLGVRGVMERVRWQREVRVGFVDLGEGEGEGEGVSAQFDEDWARAVSCTEIYDPEGLSDDEDEGEVVPPPLTLAPDEHLGTLTGAHALRGSVVDFGAFGGVWEGRATMPINSDWTAYVAHAAQPQPPRQPGRSPADVRYVLFNVHVEMQEHHHIPAVGGSEPDLALGCETDGWGGDTAFNAFFPLGFECRTVPGTAARDVYDPTTGKWVRYWTFDAARSAYGDAHVERIMNPPPVRSDFAMVPIDHVDELPSTPASASASSAYINSSAYIDSSAYEDTVEVRASGIDDVLLTGTEPASAVSGVGGPYAWFGRVRPFDGLAVFLRVPIGPARPDAPAMGRFLFTGYLHARTTLVGRWQLVDAAQPYALNVQGSFALARPGAPVPLSSGNTSVLVPPPHGAAPPVVHQNQNVPQMQMQG